MDFLSDAGFVWLGLSVSARPAIIVQELGHV